MAAKAKQYFLQYKFYSATYVLDFMQKREKKSFINVTLMVIFLSLLILLKVAVHFLEWYHTLASLFQWLLTLSSVDLMRNSEKLVQECLWDFYRFFAIVIINIPSEIHR